MLLQWAKIIGLQPILHRRARILILIQDAPRSQSRRHEFVLVSRGHVHQDEDVTLDRRYYRVSEGEPVLVIEGTLVLVLRLQKFLEALTLLVANEEMHHALQIRHVLREVAGVIVHVRVEVIVDHIWLLLH